MNPISPEPRTTPSKAEKIPVFIGTGVSIEGTIRHEGPQDERAVILGSFTGNMDWNGVLQIPRGGKIIVQQSLRCREIVVNGDISSADDNVVIETGLLRLGETAKINVATISLPPGGLEQSRGSVINANLRMSSDHPFAEPQSEPAALVPVTTRPSLALAVDNADASDSGRSSGAEFLGSSDAERAVAQAS